MPRSKKEKDPPPKKFQEAPTELFPKENSYQRRVQEWYDSKPEGYKAYVAENVLLVKLSARGKDYKPLLFLDLVAKRDEKYRYRQALNLGSLHQYETVKNLICSPFVEKIIIEIDRINKKIREYNEKIYQEKKKAAEKKQQSQAEQIDDDSLEDTDE